jgi:hypothetical protein
MTKLLTMELALNLSWLCLALTGFALLVVNLSYATKQEEQRPSNRQKIIAMICSLIFLFFVVSMTDDLHDQEIFVEESKFLKVINGMGAPVLGTSHSAVTPYFLLHFAVLRFSIGLEMPTPWRLPEPLQVPFRDAVFSRSLRGRAPPATRA